MKKHQLFFLYTITAVISIFLLPVIKIHAASLEYASLGKSDSTTGNIVIHYGGLSNKNYFTCNVNAFWCLPDGNRTPVLTSTTPVDTSIHHSFDVIHDVARVSSRGVSPDGRFVYYYQYATASNPNRQFVLVDNQTSKQYQFSENVHYWDLLTEENRIFSMSPDSKTLIYLDDRDGTPALYKVDLTHLTKSSMRGSKITRSTYSVSDFMFYDSSTIYFTANRDNPLLWSLYKYDVTNESLKKILSHTSYADPMQKVGSNLVLLQMKGNAVVPVIYDPINDSIHYFKLPETPGIEDINNPYQIVHYGSTWGTVLKPTQLSSNPTSHPLIVWLHGGPYRQVSTTIHSYLSYGVYDWVLEQARQNGAVVLKLDYHGSYAYGRKFAEALKGNAGVTDVSDVVKAVNGVKKQLGKKYQISDVYVVGNSYGGYLSLKTIVSHPEIFKGAYSINGVTDWPTLLNKIGDSIFNIYFGGLPSLANSSLYDHADIVDHSNVLTSQNKITLVQAQADTTIDPHQADFFKEVLTSKNKNINLIKIDDEDHVFSEPSSITTICSSLMDFIGVTPSSPDACTFY